MQQVVSGGGIVVPIQSKALDDRLDVELVELLSGLGFMFLVDRHFVLLDHLQDDLSIHVDVNRTLQSRVSDVDSASFEAFLLEDVQLPLEVVSAQVALLEFVGIEVLGEPGMLTDLIDAVSFLRICNQYLTDQILGLLADVVSDGVLAVHYLVVELVSVRVFEGQVATQHGVQDHATRPDVDLQTVVVLACHHFRSSVAGRATGGL